MKKLFLGILAAFWNFSSFGSVLFENPSVFSIVKDPFPKSWVEKMENCPLETQEPFGGSFSQSSQPDNTEDYGELIGEFGPLKKWKYEHKSVNLDTTLKQTYFMVSKNAKVEVDTLNLRFFIGNVCWDYTTSIFLPGENENVDYINLRQDFLEEGRLVFVGVRARTRNVWGPRGNLLIFGKN